MCGLPGARSSVRFGVGGRRIVGCGVCVRLLGGPQLLPYHTRILILMRALVHTNSCTHARTFVQVSVHATGAQPDQERAESHACQADPRTQESADGGDPGDHQQGSVFPKQQETSDQHPECRLAVAIITLHPAPCLPFCQLEETNHALSERLAWLGSKSFTVMVEDKSPASIPDNEDDQPDNIRA